MSPDPAKLKQTIMTSERTNVMHALIIANARMVFSHRIVVIARPPSSGTISIAGRIR